jgi:glycosyltransferase involved in cell wall biosynthesis
MNGFSIIVCAYNGVSRLLPTLEHLANLHIPDGYSTELILVDNASTDGTARFVTEVWHNLGTRYPLTTIVELRPGKGYAVEAGFDQALYSFILTVDDDNWLDCHYLIKAAELFNAHSDVGILQGYGEAVFETVAPAWFDNPYIAKQHVVGGIHHETGYLPATHFHAWGAGMIVHRKDWITLRKYGFSFLTSKVSGKAAGEDSELGLGLWILGRRIYYSSDLKFQHFMPAARMNWSKLKQNFDTLGYVDYYFDLYSIVIDAAKLGQILTPNQVRNIILKKLFKQFRRLTAKQHLSFWLKPQQEYYQLMLTEFYSHLRWTNKLSSSLKSDLKKIKSWVLPLLQDRGNCTIHKM